MKGAKKTLLLETRIGNFLQVGFRLSPEAPSAFDRQQRKTEEEQAKRRDQNQKVTSAPLATHFDMQYEREVQVAGGKRLKGRKHGSECPVLCT